MRPIDNQDDDFQETLSADDRELLLSMIKSHHRDYLKDFMASFKLKRSGTKEELISILEDGVQSNKISDHDLINLLDEIEEYGNQHVFIYSKLPIDLQQYKDVEFVTEKLKQHNLDRLINKKQPFFLPEKPSTPSILK